MAELGGLVSADGGDTVPAFLYPGESYIHPAQVIEATGQSITVTITVTRKLADAVVAYGMMHRMAQSSSRGASGTTHPAGEESASDADQAKRHLQALNEVTKTSFWWQIQAIVKEALSGVDAPTSEEGQRYMIALEEIGRSAHHWPAVEIAEKARKPPEKK